MGLSEGQGLGLMLNTYEEAAGMKIKTLASLNGISHGEVDVSF